MKKTNAPKLDDSSAIGGEIDPKSVATAIHEMRQYWKNHGNQTESFQESYAAHILELETLIQQKSMLVDQEIESWKIELMDYAICLLIQIQYTNPESEAFRSNMSVILTEAGLTLDMADRVCERKKMPNGDISTISPIFVQCFVADIRERIKQVIDNPSSTFSINPTTIKLAFEDVSSTLSALDSSNDLNEWSPDNDLNDE